MNFYKRHLGDIAKATGHLSQGEMGAYDLLLDWCYANEKPLPPRMADVYRIGRGTSKAEKANVDRVLADFFDQTPDGYTQKRVLVEMAKANAQAETNRVIAEERERKRRARKEHESFNENGTNRSTNDQPSQTPDTRQELPTDSAGADDRPPEPTAAGLTCLLMRKAGCARVNPSHVDLLAALDEGVTPQTLADTAAEAIASGKGEPFTWAIKTARNRHATGPSAVTGEVHGNHGTGRSVGHESVAERAARFAREGDERDAERARRANHGDAQILAADGGNLRPPLDIGLRRAV